MDDPSAQSAVTTELVARIKKMEWEIELATKPTSKGFTDYFRWRYVSGRTAEIAICRILIGEAPAAPAIFRSAAEQAHAALAYAPVPDPKTSVQDSIATRRAEIEYAILANDRTLASSYAGTPMVPGAHPRTHSLVNDTLAYALALHALVRGDDAAATRHAKEADAVPEKNTWYPGLGDAIHGIAETDPKRFTTGIDRILAQHLLYARSTRSAMFNSGSAWHCIPAIALRRIAAWRELPLSEPTGRRATIPFIIALFSGPPDSHVRDRKPVRFDFLGEEPAMAVPS